MGQPEGASRERERLSLPVARVTCTRTGFERLAGSGARVLGCLQRRRPDSPVPGGGSVSWKHHTYNLKLSDGRAASVVAYLAERGIDADRLQKVGKGESDPVADNTKEAGRQQNRRVVIRLQE